MQGGWVRGNERKLDRRKSTPLEPVLSLRKRDSSPLPRTASSKVTIPLYYQGHAYRAGSQIRVTISAPNGDQPIWAFSETEPPGTAEVARADQDAVEADPAGRPRRERPDRAAAVPGPARPALPRLPGVRQPRRHAQRALVGPGRKSETGDLS